RRAHGWTIAAPPSGQFLPMHPQRPPARTPATMGGRCSMRARSPTPPANHQEDRMSDQPRPNAGPVPATIPANGKDDIFLSPRVVDRQAFNEFAAQLRTL